MGAPLTKPTAHIIAYTNGWAVFEHGILFSCMAKIPFLVRKRLEDPIQPFIR
jgi:hypothetical protein